MNHILLTLFMIPLFFSSEKPETVRTLPAENKNVITTKDAVKIRQILNTQDSDIVIVKYNQINL